MKHFVLALFVVAAVAVPPAFAGSGHAHGPSYGGVLREIRHVAYELVATPESLTLYVSDHGKPVSTTGASAEAVIYAGNDRIAVKLEPAGENRMEARGAFKVGVGVRVALTVTLAGKSAVKPVFNLK
jgi:hypothetical protein